MRLQKVCNCGTCDVCHARETSDAHSKVRTGGQLTGKELMHGYMARPKGMRNRNKHRQPGTKRERIH